MSNIVKCKFCKPDIENFNILRSFLPDDYEYLVCNFNSDSSNFKTRLRTNGKNQEYAHKWLDDFQMHSKCTMRIERTYPHSGTKNVFKVDLRCQHNTRPRSEKVREKESCKNTDCPAKMGITIKRVVTERKSRSKDPHLPDYPSVIQMDFRHNHAILTPEILKHRSVLPEVKEKILALFKLGHNPATALDMHKYDLLLEHGENFEKICHDRALLPDPQFCYRLYYKIIRKQSLNDENPGADLPANVGVDKKVFAPLSSCENSSSLNASQIDSFSEEMLCQDASVVNSEKKNKKKRKLENSVIGKNEMLSQLEAVLCKFCESGGFAGMQLIDDNIVMAMCTPLMHRVHNLIKQSGELVFVDAYGDTDEPNSCRILLFVTYSSIGAVPLGCIVSTSVNVECFKAAIELWKQILPEGCFYNKSDGPDIFFTNDHEVERQSLKICYPKSHLLICLSHILQASWNFLWDRKNAIKKDHRSMLFSKVKMLLYSQSVEELEMNYAYTIGDNLVKSYTIFLEYVKNIYNHRHDWSLIYRRNLLPGVNDVSTFWESSILILKDPILSRTRTFNTLQIIDFLSRLDTYYERRLIDLANNRLDRVRLARFLFIELPREAYTITQNTESEYEVHNDTKDTTYQVDVTLGMCECRIGKSGAPCKHQLLVFRNFPIPVYDCVLPNSSNDKNLLLHLASGQEIENDAAEASIKTGTVMQECAPDISIHDLEPCGNDFFLDENGTCESLNHSSDMTHNAVLNPPNSLMPSNALLQTSHVLQQHSSVISSQDSMLTESNLLIRLEQNSHQSISLAPQINSLNQHLTVVNQNSETIISPHATLLTIHPPPPPPPPPCAVVNRPNQQVQTVLNLLDQICTKLKERTSRSPQTFKPALGTFLKNLENLSSDSSLEYALYSFGKFSKSATPLFRRKILDNKLIGLQSAGELKRKRTPLKCAKLVKKQC